MSHKRIFMLLFILPVILFSITGCTYLQEMGIIPTQPERTQEQPETQPQPESPPKPPAATAPSGGIIINLSFADGAPLLNQEAELRCTISSKRDIQNTIAQILLPEGATLVDGNLEWQGDLKAGVPTSFSAQIVFRETGKWSIEVKARNEGGPSPGLWHGMDVVYITVWDDHSEFGWPPTGPVPVKRVD